MAQIEQIIGEYLNKNPQIRLSYAQGLINRRALARKIIDDEKSLSKSQFEATIAALRRIQNQKQGTSSQKILSDFSILIKDGIAIANLSKSKDTIRQIQSFMPQISYEKNQTLKMVVGSESIKVFIDSKNSHLIEKFVCKSDILYMKKSITEISLSYPSQAREQKGIISYVSTCLFLHGIAIEEFLTCSPELLLYVNEKDSLKAYEILKNMQKK